MTKYNILIVEDHALTRFGLKTAFETASCKISEAENAKKAFKILDKESIDVVIMDLGLPDINGIDATKTIKEKHPSIKVVILSSHEKEEEVIKALKSGACAYCTKDISPEKLITIVESVLKGAAWFDPKVAQYVLNAATASEQRDESSKEKSAPQKTAKPKKTEASSSSLTTREKQVLGLLSDGLTNGEIAKELNVSINTTKAHVCNILQKLGVQDRTQAAIKALKNNII